MRALLALAFLAVQMFAQTHVRVAGRDVVVWKPEGPAPSGGFPVIVFSHGFSGCGTQSKFLTASIAHAGYLVLAPNHADARCGAGNGMPKPEESFAKTENWNEATYRDREADIRAVLDAVLAGQSSIGVATDPGRVALVGHSLGGYTALGLAGGWPSWKDSRVKAVLALSPFCSPYVSKGDLAHLQVPVMYQGGTLDVGITPTVRRLNGAYDRSGNPKYYVEFRGAGHLAWTDLNPKFHDIISQYSVAFLNRFVKGAGNTLDALAAAPLPPLVSFVRSDLK